MGKYKFKLSDMLPNAWFYKLKDMNNNSKSKNSQSTPKKKPHFSQPFCFSTKLNGLENSPFTENSSGNRFPEPARRSWRRRSRRKTVYKPSPRIGVHECSTSEDEASSDSFDDLASWSSSCRCTFPSSSNDIIIDMNREFVGRRIDQLPPLFSRNSMVLDQKDSEATKLRSSYNPKTGARKSNASPVGVKLRANSPRLARRKIQQQTRKNVPSYTVGFKLKSSCLSESFAMIKASNDPQQDFRESMVEMIVENNIKNSKDLEELLACYLILNSDEYHDVIIRTFEQIWFDMPELRL